MKHRVLHQPSSRQAKMQAAIGFKLVSIAAAVGIAYVAAAPQVVHAQEAVVAFHLPAQPLGDALTALAIQSGRQVAYEEAQVKGKRSTSVSGQLTVRQALDGVLAGSGLSVSVNGAVITVYDAQNSAGEKTLPAIVVNNTTATEGTGSYTTHTMTTATKLGLSMRETPQAATVVTRARMDDQAMTDINDVVRSTPGLYVDSYGGVGRQSFSARGFSVDTVMEDGVPRNWDNGYIPGTQSNLAMYDRVEVVRGATGLMQGAGTPSAALNLIRKRPTKTFQGAVTAAVGSWDDYSASVDLGGALNAAGTLRGRIIASRQDAKSFRDVEAHNHDLFYGIIEADIASGTMLTLGASQQKDSTNYIWGGIPLTPNGQHMVVPTSFFAGTDWQYMDNKMTTVFATLDQVLVDDWKLRFNMAKTWSDNDILATILYRETTGGDTFHHYAWQAARKADYFSYDLYVNGTLNLLGRQHELVVGSNRSINNSTQQNYTGGFINSGVDVGSWDPYSTAKPNYVPTTSRNTVIVQDSAYVTTRLNISDAWKVILGGRLDWYDYDNRSGTGSYTVMRNLTRYAGVIYDLNDQHSLYASYTDIFKPQTTKDIHDNILEPVVGKNYELGIKGEYFGGTLNASAAIFQIDQTNRSMAVADKNLCPNPAIGCAEPSGLVRSRGIDLEIQGAITPDWQLAAGYTFVDTKYVTDANKANEGKPFDTKQPKNLFKLTSSYKLPGSLSQWRVNGTVYRQSAIYGTGVTNGVVWRNEQKAYVLVDLGAGYKVNDHLDLQLNMSNVFNKTYYQAITDDTDWWPMEAYGAPRKFKLTARYTF